jgi:hypothetical protein
MRKTITYQWHLAELMARAGMHNSTDLLPHLKERGIDLSPPRSTASSQADPNGYPCSSSQLCATSSAAARRTFHLHLEHTHEEGGIGRQRCRPRQDRPA